MSNGTNVVVVRTPPSRRRSSCAPISICSCLDWITRLPSAIPGRSALMRLVESDGGVDAGRETWPSAVSRGAPTSAADSASIPQQRCASAPLREPCCGRLGFRCVRLMFARSLRNELRFVWKYAENAAHRCGRIEGKCAERLQLRAPRRNPYAARLAMSARHDGERHRRSRATSPRRSHRHAERDRRACHEGEHRRSTKLPCDVAGILDAGSCWHRSSTQQHRQSMSITNSPCVS